MKPVHALLNTAIAILVAAGVIVAAAGLWFRDAVYFDRSRPEAPAEFVVPRGASFGDVVAGLESAGILAHPTAFRLLARLRNDEADIQSGQFRFPAHQTSDEVLRRLVSGAVDALWVTFPEGFTARQMGARLAERSLGSAAAFDRYAAHAHLVVDGVRTRSLEGFLFPSTYLVPTGARPAGIAQILTDQFFRELPEKAASKARALGLNVPQVITVASLIEREAQADDERALMAGVYYNRLRAGMPLQVDATIEYIFPEHHAVITRRDLEIDSPYNTYRYTGLPPTPIANPGKASIDAAFSPVRSKYLYYVYKGNGHHAFAQTLEEHNANVERYLH
ncbi:MAG TPA: endolytic transglycosylase MltG [Candidatus Lustribacter sp.]|nr:endolytic transglycosylase MltG [Candidatus Lustribacter sp.]